MQWLIPLIYLARLQMLPAKSRCRPGDSPPPARHRSAASKTLGRSILRWRQGNWRPWRRRWRWRGYRWRGLNQNRRPLQEIHHQKQNAYSLKAPKGLFCTNRDREQQAKLNRKPKRERGREAKTQDKDQERRRTTGPHSTPRRKQNQRKNIK